MTSVLVRRGDFGHRQAQREDSVKTQGGRQPSISQERVLEELLPSWPPGGSGPADTLVEDFPIGGRAVSLWCLSHPVRDICRSRLGKLIQGGTWERTGR